LYEPTNKTPFNGKFEKVGILGGKRGEGNQLREALYRMRNLKQAFGQEDSEEESRPGRKS